MNLFLIKIGKAFQAIRNDGLFHGGKRVCKGFFTIFRRVHPGDILIITGGIGDSARYRADHQAEELRMQGFRVSTTLQDNPFLSRYHRKFNVFVFHRVLYTSTVKHLIESIKKDRKTIVFDTDDLVFDKKYLMFMDYYAQKNALGKKLYENGVGGEILADPYVKVCTTTTAFLAEKLREKRKTVYVVPNKLSQNDLQWVDAILAKKQEKKPDGLIRIGYFSGTHSHNKDFATITDALIVLLRRYKKVQLCLAGPLDIDPRLSSEFKDRIFRIPFTSRSKYFKLLSNIDINLAPLERGNPFCEAKSELKFFEPGILCIPTVAVRNKTFSEVIEDGVNGFLAGNISEWINKIEMLIQSKLLREKMGYRARKISLENYSTPAARNNEYYAYLTRTQVLRKAIQ